MIESQGGNSNGDRYLVFELGQELFATPLIEVRSVIEFHAAKPVPHTPLYYKGVINIRGEIVGVIDIRERLGIQGSDRPKAQLVFETDLGSLAATVDKVQAVVAIPEADLDRKAGGAEGAKERDYFLGIAKYDGKLLTVISLRKLAPQENFSASAGSAV